MSQDDLLNDVRERMAAFRPVDTNVIVCGIDGANQAFKMPLSEFFDLNEHSADEQFLIQCALAIDGTASVALGNGDSSTIHLVTTAH